MDRVDSHRWTGTFPERIPREGEGSSGDDGRGARPASLDGRSPRGRRWRRWTGLWLVAAGALTLLAGCAGVPRQDPLAPAALLHDERFQPSPDVIDAAQVIAPSAAMREFIRSRPGLRAHQRDARDALLDALYTRGELKLQYDAEMTRTAAEAFDARSGNCLSLTLMTAAFAREIGLPVVFRQVHDQEQWSRVGDLQVVSGHVNIALMRRQGDVTALGEAPMLVVDFLPGANIRQQRAIELDEAAVIAMYMNNRAAEWLSTGQLDRAYWWARGAWLHDPRMLSALNTLGVIYRRRGDAAYAEQAFRAVLTREPGNTQAMSNLVLTLRQAGHLEEVGLWEERLAQLQPYPPFKFFDMGVEAMRAGDYGRARELFGKEIDRSAYYHQFHFWMALANIGLGQWSEVRKSLATAQDVSTTAKDRQLYAAKLASLQEQERARGLRRP